MADLVRIEVDPEMIWATVVDTDEIRVFVNEEDTLTFDRKSAERLVAQLSIALKELP